MPLAGLALALGASGCLAPRGETLPRGFSEALARSLPDEPESVALVGPGYWYPATDGFRSERELLLPGATPDVASAPGASPGSFGVLALTRCHLYVLDWSPDAERYAVRFELPYPAIARMRVATLGGSRRLVLWDRRGVPHSFSFLQHWSPQGREDAGRTQAAADLVFDAPLEECR